MLKIRSLIQAWRRARAGGALSGLALGATLLVPAVAQAGPPGPLTVGQLFGRNGCLSKTGSHGVCRRVRTLDPGRLNGTGSVAIDPKGRNVYVAAADGDAVIVLSRDRLTGAVRQTGCVASHGRGGCVRGRGLEAASAAAVSPNGRNVYVTSALGAVAVFSRDPHTGALVQTGCVGDSSIEGCGSGEALGGASDVAVSPDGRHVYVASRLSSAVSTFSRDRATGALRQTGCVADFSAGRCASAHALAGANSISLSPRGELAYVTSSDAVALFARDASTGELRQRGCASADGSRGACAAWRALEGAASAAASPDGRHVYVAAAIGNSVTAFRVERGGAGLTVAGCVSAEGSRRCTRAYALNGAAAVSMAPNGRTVYVASGRFSHGLAVFRRNARTGRLRELGCITSRRGARACARGVGMRDPTTAALSPDGRNLYVLARTSDALAVIGPDIGIVGRRWRVSARGVVRLRLVCPANARTRCRGRLVLRTVKRVRIPGGRARHATLGWARFSVRPGRTRSLAVRVARELIPFVRRSRPLSVRPLVFPAS